MAISDHHDYLHLQTLVRRQGHAQARVLQAEAADKPCPAQYGAKKHGAPSQQDAGSTQVWGSQQVLLLCVLQGCASLAWCGLLAAAVLSAAAQAA